MNKIIIKVFNKTVESYEQILENYYPAYDSNGFTERNQTFNFSHNYLLLNPNAIIWQEVPIWNKKHFDTLIIDNEENCIIIIEAKRLGTETNFISIQKDFDRIKEKHNSAVGVTDKFNEGYSLYALLLVDLWIPKENREKKLEQKVNFEKMKGFGYFSHPINEDTLESNETYHLGFKLVKIAL